MPRSSTYQRMTSAAEARSLTSSSSTYSSPRAMYHLKWFSGVSSWYSVNSLHDNSCRSLRDAGGQRRGAADYAALSTRGRFAPSRAASMTPQDSRAAAADETMTPTSRSPSRGRRAPVRPLPFAPRVRSRQSPKAASPAAPTAARENRAVPIDLICSKCSMMLPSNRGFVTAVRPSDAATRGACARLHGWFVAEHTPHSRAGARTFKRLNVVRDV